MVDSLDVMVGLRLLALELDFLGLAFSLESDEGRFLCDSIFGSFLAADMIDSNALLGSLLDFLLET